jgi:hypothetical protein
MRTTDNMVGRIQASYQYDPISLSTVGTQMVQSVAATNVYFIGNYTYSGARYVQRPRTRVEIDLNVRVRGNDTFVGFEDVSGPIGVDEDVEVYESESGVVGDGKITEIDGERELVYLSVDWSSLTEAKAPSGGVTLDSTSPTQLLFVGEASTTTTFSPETWAEMMPRPCLVGIGGSENTIWITAPVYEHTYLVASRFGEPYVEMRQNVTFGRSVVAA